METYICLFLFARKIVPCDRALIKLSKNIKYTMKKTNIASEFKPCKFLCIFLNCICYFTCFFHRKQRTTSAVSKRKEFCKSVLNLFQQIYGWPKTLKRIRFHIFRCVTGIIFSQHNQKTVTCRSVDVFFIFTRFFQQP